MEEHAASCLALTGLKHGVLKSLLIWDLASTAVGRFVWKDSRYPARSWQDLMLQFVRVGLNMLCLAMPGNLSHLLAG